MLASIQSKTDFLAPSSSSSTRSFSTSMARSSRELIPRAMEKLVERRRRSSRTRCFRGRKKKFRPRRIREPLFFSTSIEKRSFALFVFWLGASPLTIEARSLLPFQGFRAETSADSCEFAEGASWLVQKSGNFRERERKGGGGSKLAPKPLVPIFFFLSLSPSSSSFFRSSSSSSSSSPPLLLLF